MSRSWSWKTFIPLLHYLYLIFESLAVFIFFIIHTKLYGQATYEERRELDGLIMILDNLDRITN